MSGQRRHHRPLIVGDQVLAKNRLQERQCSAVGVVGRAARHRRRPVAEGGDQSLFGVGLGGNGRRQRLELGKTRLGQHRRHVLPRREDIGHVLLRAAVVGHAHEGRHGEHLTEQMIGEAERVQPSRQHHAAGVGRGVGGILKADFAVHLPADVHYHAQEHRQRQHGEHREDADRAALVAVGLAKETQIEN